MTDDEREQARARETFLKWRQQLTDDLFDLFEKWAEQSVPSFVPCYVLAQSLGYAEAIMVGLDKNMGGNLTRQQVMRDMNKVRLARYRSKIKEMTGKTEPTMH